MGSWDTLQGQSIFGLGDRNNIPTFTLHTNLSMATSDSKSEDREIEVQTDETVFKRDGGILFDIGEHDKQEIQSGLKLSKNGHVHHHPAPHDSMNADILQDSSHPSAHRRS
jgi:hypothetical protein